MCAMDKAEKGRAFCIPPETDDRASVSRSYYALSSPIAAYYSKRTCTEAVITLEYSHVKYKIFVIAII